MDLWYVNNAGIILKSGEYTVGIDIFTEKDDSPYMHFEAEKLEQWFCQGRIPRPDVLLSTHAHTDHFSTKDTGNYLKKHPEVIFWGSDETLRLLTETDVPLCHLFSPLSENKELRTNGFLIRRIPSPHMGSAAPVTDHVSFLLETGEGTIAFPGDARPSEAFYHSLQEYTAYIHTLIAPFPCLGLKTARKCLRNVFCPKYILLVHLADPEKDVWNWLDSTKKIWQKTDDGLPSPIFCQTFGAHYSLI